MLPRNPADGAEPPRVERRTMRTYDVEQTAELLEALRGTRLFVPVSRTGCRDVAREIKSRRVQDQMSPDPGAPPGSPTHLTELAIQLVRYQSYEPKCRKGLSLEVKLEYLRRSALREPASL
jgi:hypothetical protein